MVFSKIFTKPVLRLFNTELKLRYAHAQLSRANLSLAFCVYRPLELTIDSYALTSTRTAHYPSPRPPDGGTSSRKKYMGQHKENDPGSHGAGTSVSERPYPPCWTSSGRWAPACLPAVSRFHRGRVAVGGEAFSRHGHPHPRGDSPTPAVRLCWIRMGVRCVILPRTPGTDQAVVCVAMDIYQGVPATQMFVKEVRESRKFENRWFNASNMLIFGTIAIRAQRRRILDFPNKYPRAPSTVKWRTHFGAKFSCHGRPAGYYADIPTACQSYHMCDTTGRQFTYQCPNMTLFQQRMMICNHWYMVDCSQSEQSYDANLLIGQRDKPFVGSHEHNHTPGQ
uniref:Chitin-binding type-2 domain-containing protein n=1 Tax=Timema genevievae TaxID=629358 RepID=A0A7R9PKZ8_TIMGE|nr:unnamed protein product [Timema genevievae]